MVVIISLHGKIKYLALSASAVCRQWGSQCVFQACPPSCSWLSYTNMLVYRLVSTQSGPKGKWVLVTTFKDCSSCFSRLNNILEHSLGAQPPTSGKVLWQEGVWGGRSHCIHLWSGGRERDTLVLSILSSFHPLWNPTPLMVPPTLRVSLPSSIKPFWNQWWFPIW